MLARQSSLAPLSLLLLPTNTKSVVQFDERELGVLRVNGKARTLKLVNDTKAANASMQGYWRELKTKKTLAKCWVLCLCDRQVIIVM